MKSCAFAFPIYASVYFTKKLWTLTIIMTIITSALVCFWILYIFLLLLPFISICYSLLRFRLNNYPLKSFPINSRVINYKLTVKKDSWLYYIDLVQMHCCRKYHQYWQKIIRFIIKSSIRDTVKACLWKIEKNQNCEKYLNLVYTKTVDSVFRALWLATQPVNILHYSLIHPQFLRASDAKLA